MRVKRREVLSCTPAAFLLLGSSWRFAFAKSEVRAPRVDKVMWGGLGFSVPNNEISGFFPMVSAAITGDGGLGGLASTFARELEKSYPGGVAEDPAGLLDTTSDPSLLFTVSLDFEQLILVPNEGGATEFQLSFVYGIAQVLYLDLPRAGGSDGDMRVLYSFPFRVQSGETSRVGNASDRISNFKKLLFDVENSFVNVFRRKVASKAFREARVPKRLKVMSAKISPEAAAVIEELGLSQQLSSQFFGQAFTSSLAERGDISVLPFAQNDTLNGALAGRFNKHPNISKIFGRLNDAEDSNYTIDLTIHRILRRSNGSNIGNIIYARGISVFIKVTDVYKRSLAFDRKILLIENNELPKAMLDRLKDYDLRYMIQIAIKMFDLFTEAVIAESPEKFKILGVDPPLEIREVKMLKDLLLSCRY